MASTKILVQGIKLYAYHGCMKEESVIGGNYIVDISIEADLNKPERSDKLDQTVDYVTVYEIVKKEMATPSKLIEHVAKRILDSLKSKFPQILFVEVKVTKLNPPIPGEVEKVTVVISE
jgi:dihydroneopterin aldolase